MVPEKSGVGRKPTSGSAKYAPWGNESRSIELSIHCNSSVHFRFRTQAPQAREPTDTIVISRYATTRTRSEGFLAPGAAADEVGAVLMSLRFYSSGPEATSIVNSNTSVRPSLPPVT